MTNQALTLDTRILLIDADCGEIYSWPGTGYNFRTMIPDSDCCTVTLRDAIQVCREQDWQILGFIVDPNNGEIEVRVNVDPRPDWKISDFSFTEGMKTIPAHLFSA